MYLTIVYPENMNNWFSCNEKHQAISSVLSLREPNAEQEKCEDWS